MLEYAVTYQLIVIYRLAKKGTLTPLRFFGMYCRRLSAAVTSLLKDLGEKLMQRWMEIKVVTLHRLIATMRIRAVIEARGGLRNITVFDFLLAWQCIILQVCYNESHCNVSLHS